MLYEVITVDNPRLETPAGALLFSPVNGSPASVLATGDYRLRIEGWQDDWDAAHAYDVV